MDENEETFRSVSCSHLTLNFNNCMRNSTVYQSNKGALKMANNIYEF